MKITFIEQHIYFVFDVNGEYYRTSFERSKADADWSVRLVDVSRNETVYSKILNAIVTPDSELAKEMINTYVSRGG